MRMHIVKTKRNTEEKDKDSLHRVRLPGFLIEQEVGLGDVIKRASAVVGIRPCGGCEKRAATLNRWMTFTR
jgi:hypothetical protein